MQTCKYCQIQKPLSEFYIRKESGLYRKDCKSCNKAVSTEYAKNSTKRKEYMKSYAAKKSLELKEYRSKYYITNRQDIYLTQAKYDKKRSQIDPLYVMQKRLRSRIGAALKHKSWKKTTKFSQYIGCSLEEFKAHIENQFVVGMSWENRSQWHLDHIIPLSSAQSVEELEALCHYKNIQPLWAIDNILKSDKMPMTDSAIGDITCR